ncbi:tetratricopeptide repeat protein [Lignipirellula cremea]|nr:tetratricopeptide repeat protein [Lignipirellula cremea]
MTCLIGTVTVLPVSAAEEDEQVAGLVAVHTPQTLIDKNMPVAEVGPGEVLSVLAQREEFLWVETAAQKRGWILKNAVVNLADADVVFDTLIKQEPTNWAFYGGRALVWEARGDAEKALADYDKAIELGLKDPLAYVSRGMFYAAAGKLDEALKDYDQAIELGLKNEQVYSNRAAAYMAKRDFEKAMRDYDAVVAMKPEDPAAYYQRAAAAKIAGDYEAAIKDFGLAIRLQPNHTPALNGRGYMYFMTGKSREAIADFDKVIQLNPQDALAYNNRGFNYQQLGEFKKALADYAKTNELAPSYSLAHQNRAWLLATCPDEKIRDGKQALESGENACRISEYRSPYDVKSLAAAYAEIGDFENAVKWQTKVVTLLNDEDSRQIEREILKMYADKKPYRLKKAD